MLHVSSNCKSKCRLAQVAWARDYCVTVRTEPWTVRLTFIRLVRNPAVPRTIHSSRICYPSTSIVITPPLLSRQIQEQTQPPHDRQLGSSSVAACVLKLCMAPVNTKKLVLLVWTVWLCLCNQQAVAAADDTGLQYLHDQLREKVMAFYYVW